MPARRLVKSGCARDNAATQSGPESMTGIEDSHLIRRVQVANTTFVLLGTAHVSPQSVADVQREIGNGEYDAVAVELCDSRYRSLMDPQSLERLDLFEVLKSGRAGMVMASLALGAYQQRLARQFDIQPGAELQAAVKGGQRRGIPVWVVDREIGTTLKRVYRSVPWWQRYSIFTGLIGSLLSRQQVTTDDIERLKQGDMLESTFSEFAAESSALHAPLIDERDRYMAARLLESIRSAGTPPPHRGGCRRRRSGRRAEATRSAAARRRARPPCRPLRRRSRGRPRGRRGWGAGVCRRR